MPARSGPPGRAARPAPRTGIPPAPGAGVPQGPRSRRRRLAAPAAIGAAAAAGTVLVGLVDPGQPGHYPLCPLRALTGLACPACGALRATHALAHLDLAAATGFNPLWTIAVPFLVVAWVVWVVRAWRGSGPVRRVDGPVRADGAGAGPARAARGVVPRPAVVLLVVVVAFGVARNVPALQPWLGP